MISWNWEMAMYCIGVFNFCYYPTRPKAPWSILNAPMSKENQTPREKHASSANIRRKKKAIPLITPKPSFVGISTSRGGYRRGREDCHLEKSMVVT